MNCVEMTVASLEFDIAVAFRCRHGKRDGAYYRTMLPHWIAALWALRGAV